MGTRHLTIVLKNGEHKVAQYCQWDGYPEGQGRTAYLLLKGNVAVVEQSLDKCQWITEEQIEQRWRAAHDACDIEWEGMEHGFRFEVGEAMTNLYPEMERSHGALVLDSIMNSVGPIYLQDGIEFAANDTFCEWIWIVDFDNRVFQAFEPTKWHEYDAVENQESYLDTLDLDIKMTKVLELDLDDLPKSQDAFLASFSKRE